MSNRLSRLFDRFVACHGDLPLSPLSLTDTEGEIFGHLERIAVSGGRYRVTGWALAAQVGLICGPARTAKAPDLSRDDVLRAKGIGAIKTPGFALDLPADQGRATLWAERDGVRYVFTLPQTDGAALRRMRRRLAPDFAARLGRALPDILRWSLRRDAGSVARIKAALGFTPPQRSERLNTHLFVDDVTAPPDPPARLAQTGVTIVLPVHNAFDLLPEVLDRVLRNTDLPWRLIVVEDASTDPAVRPWLRDWHAGLDPARRDRVTLIENDRNLGFIASVNLAFAQALRIGRHVILLNSDALVPQGWASRLIRPILDHQNVATVTPMSNDAEILTAPAICARHDLAPGQADAIDRVAARFCSGADLADIPTGVGFCMAINIAWLRRLPTLDTTFGRGYGEEVDWCQKIRAIGGRHLGLGGLFVEHRGGASFGSAEKRRLIARNSTLISQRYPSYDAEVQAFLQRDPLIDSRLALAFSWAGATARASVPVYLGHSLGGGAEMDLARRIADNLADCGAAAVLRVGGTARLRIELHSPGGVTTGDTDDLGFARRLVTLLPRREIVYSCGVGDPDPVALPAFLMALAQGGQGLRVLVHDYLPLSPSYTLLGQDGVYRGLPDPARNTDPAHDIRRPDGRLCPLADWRAAWDRLLTRADRVEVFSEASHALLAAACPAARLAVLPHRPLASIPRVAPGAGGSVVVGVLGNIGLQKGAAVIAGLSRDLDRSGAARLVVIGDVDPAFPLAASVRVHGAYRHEDLPALVGRYGITCWLIPSVWPETFSFTTHEALATGLPVWAFDLGAQGAAAATQPQGQGGVLPLALAQTPGALAGALCPTALRVSA